MPRPRRRHCQLHRRRPEGIAEQRAAADRGSRCSPRPLSAGVPLQRDRVMTDIAKRVKRLLRECAAAAHEEELRRALLPIAEAFKRWEQGGLASGELSELIHRFHQGRAREVYVRYDTNQLEAPVAYAIVTGVLDRKAAPAEVLDHVARMIRFYEERASDAARNE